MQRRQLMLGSAAALALASAILFGASTVVNVLRVHHDVAAVDVAYGQLDLRLRLPFRYGIATVTAQTATSLQVTITGASAGKGSLLIQGTTRSLQLADLYRVATPKPAVAAPVYRETDVTFDARSVKLSKSDIAAIRAGVASGKVIGEEFAGPLEQHIILPPGMELADD